MSRSGWVSLQEVREALRMSTVVGRLSRMSLIGLRPFRMSERGRKTLSDDWE